MQKWKSCGPIFDLTLPKISFLNPRAPRSTGLRFLKESERSLKVQFWQTLRCTRKGGPGRCPSHALSAFDGP
eukprot:1154179-Pelagomonas_calceolata.AAC.5